MALLTSLRTRGSDDWRFALQWLRHPARLGAVLPSGEALAAALAQQVDLEGPGTVVELGAGTGSVTRAIFDAGLDPRDLVVIEREPPFCAILMERFPDLRLIHGNALELEALLNDADVDNVKTIISGLPLLAIPIKDRRKLLTQALSVLEPDGVFVQYTYGPGSPVTAGICTEMGLTAERSNWVLANLPPASVWRYTRKNAASPLRRAA